MSTVDYTFGLGGLNAPQPPLTSSGPGPRPRRFHRIAEVREQQGTSIRSVARKLNLPMQDVRDQEKATTDLHLSQLLAWQQALEVPLADLLIDSEAPLSSPVNARAQMLRVMKTAKALSESAASPGTQRLATMLVGQLIDLMPELAEVSAWHSVGQRRTQDELGRIAEQSLPDSVFGDMGS
ncbi:MAG: hypothetical protein CMJ58_23430 [Planctomycetaceae bacterium]|nr:hypothetical protein [Planctomycetaceae bacterium]